MKVALVCPNFPPEFTGGTEQVVRALARSMRQQGSDVLVVSGSDQPHRGQDVEREDDDGVPVCRLKRNEHEGYGLDIERPRLQKVFDDLCTAEGIDVVHVNHWSTLTDGLVRGARAAGRAAVVTLHDVWTTCPRFFRSPPGGITCPIGAERDACAHCCALGLAQTDEWCRDNLVIRDATMRAELEAAQALTVPSRTSGDRIATHLPWDPAAFEVVPHGLLQPVKGFEPEPAADPRVLRVGTFGNLVEPKGVMLLVYACRGIPNVELHLFGPFLEAPFETLVKEKAEEFGVSLHCHGRYRTGEAHPARHLDLAVFPSLCEETYGLVVEEALARDVPVVVSDRGALHERIGEGGVVVAVDEVGPLHQTLRRYAQDRDALTALRAGIPRAFRTIDDAASRFLEIYRTVLER